MNDPLEESRPKSLLHAVFRSPRPLEKESALFVLVSALDFYMTHLLLVYSNAEAGGNSPHFYESNPFARFFLDHWGIRGMIFFKFGIVAFVAVIAQIVATRKLNSARWLLNFATVLVACTVIYSLTLLLRHSSLLAM